MSIKLRRILRSVAKVTLGLTTVLLLGYVGYVTYLSVKNKPYKVRVSNVTDSAFTVSWVTDEPMKGIVYYGEKDNFLPGPLAWLGKKKAVDDRDATDAMSECVSKFNKKVSKTRDENFSVDASGFDCNDVKVRKFGQYYTHHVTVQNLEADKEYFFRVGDGYISYKEGKIKGVKYIEREILGIPVFMIKTLPTIRDIGSPKPAYGTSYNVFYNNEGEAFTKKNFDSIIFLKTFKGGIGYPLMSAVTNNDGGWAIDLSNVRKSNGESLEMEDTYLEFIPQVDNARPGASGTTKFEELSFPLNLMGNNFDDLNKDKDIEDLQTVRLLKEFVGKSYAAPSCFCSNEGGCASIPRNTCTSMGGTCYITKSSCCTASGLDASCNRIPSRTCYKDSCPASVTPCGSAGSRDTHPVCKKCYKCEGGELREEYSRPDGSCNSGYTYNKPNCRVSSVDCFCTSNSCASSIKKEGRSCNPSQGCYANKVDCIDNNVPVRSIGSNKTCCKPSLNGNQVSCSCLEKQSSCNTSAGYHEYANETDCQNSTVMNGECKNGRQQKIVNLMMADSGGGSGAKDDCGNQGSTKGDSSSEVSVWRILYNPNKQENECTEESSNINAVPLGYFGSKKACTDALKDIANELLGKNFRQDYSGGTDGTRGTGGTPRCNGEGDQSQYEIKVDPLALRGHCYKGESYCYVGIYHKGSWNLAGELCRYVKVSGQICGAVACEEEESLTDAIPGSPCNDTRGCLCEGGRIEFREDCGSLEGEPEVPNSTEEDKDSEDSSDNDKEKPHCWEEVDGKCVGVEDGEGNYLSKESCNKNTEYFSNENSCKTSLEEESPDTPAPPVSNNSEGNICCRCNKKTQSTTRTSPIGVYYDLHYAAFKVSSISDCSRTGFTCNTENMTEGGLCNEAQLEISGNLNNVFLSKSMEGYHWLDNPAGYYCCRNKGDGELVISSNKCNSSDQNSLRWDEYCAPYARKFITCYIGDNQKLLRYSYLASENNRSCPSGREVNDSNFFCYAEGISQSLREGVRRELMSTCIDFKGDIGSPSSEVLPGIERERKFIKSVEANSSNNTSRTVYFPESGLYKFDTRYGGEVKYIGAEGERMIAYIERNGIPGFQSPKNLANPTEDEDLLLDSSEIILSVEQIATTKDIELKKGVNIISFDIFPSEGENVQLMSNRFLELMNQSGQKISSISYFSGSQWAGGNTYDFKTGEVKGSPFSLSQGRGYVLIAERDTTISVPGYKTSTQIPIAFSSGWNLVGVHGHQKAYTAESFINSINSTKGLKADNVTWWPTSKGRYEGYQVSQGQTYGQDFPISPLNGYFVRITDLKHDKPECKSILWNPGGQKNEECGTQLN